MKFGLVVLGAHIGVHIRDDILKQNNKPSLLVEPVPHNIEEIKINLKDIQNIIIEPIAISNKNGTKKFYYVKHDSIGKLGKHWASGIGSFDKNHILNHRSKRFKIEDVDIETVDIECKKFNELVKKYEIEEIDKMIIDIEGSEYDILEDLDLNQIKISEILFEYKHFDGHFKTGNKLEKILNKFEKNNYKTSKIDQENILAIKI
tara:strand:- start:361 stop:972 length:612 start_codon:yes stop_codon:yes gene_type:complete